jgi:glucose-6-phosphate 1-dehydrogenase
VPVYIRAGKCLPATAVEVTVQFHAPPRPVFGEEAKSVGHMRMRVSPDVSVAMGLKVKRPGDKMTGEPVELILSEQVASLTPPYQRLLGDAMRGDGELFSREDIVDAQWRIVEPVLKNPPPVVEYEPGTWGPEAAEELIGSYGPWRNPEPSA